MLFDLQALDEHQRAVVDHGEGPAGVMAAPGSGKTRTVISRVLDLHHNHGVPMDEILCTTFSNTGENAMSSRLGSAIKAQSRNKDPRRPVRTINSLGLYIVNSSGGRVQTISDGGKKGAHQILRDYCLKKHRLNDRYMECWAHICRWRRMLIGPKRAVVEMAGKSGVLQAYAESYYDYDQYLKAEGLVDFETQVFRAVQILKRDEARREQWQRRWRYIIIDEAHDTNHAQQVLTTLLLDEKKNIMIVGDPQQAIYGFRGADASILVDFPEHFPDGKVYYLPVNYRSKTIIVGAAKKLTANVKVPLARRLIDSTRANTEACGSIAAIPYFSRIEEARAVAEQVENTIRRGEKPDNIAVLARTNAQLIAPAIELSDRTIPVKWLGTSLWQNPAVRRMVSTAQFALNDKAYIAFTFFGSSPSVLNKGLKRQLCTAVAEIAKKAGVSPLKVRALPNGHRKKQADWDIVRGRYRAFCGTMQRLAEVSTAAQWFDEMLRHTGMRSGASARSDKDSGTDFADESIEVMMEVAMNFKRPRDFVGHAVNASIAANTDRGVRMGTMHASKGLEWEKVFLIGVEAGKVPHYRATDLAEELRILYVGMTRAKTDLVISWTDRRSPLLAPVASMFEDDVD